MIHFTSIILRSDQLLVGRIVRTGPPTMTSKSQLQVLLKKSPSNLLNRPAILISCEPGKAETNSGPIFKEIRFEEFRVGRKAPEVLRKMDDISLSIRVESAWHFLAKQNRTGTANGPPRIQLSV